MWQKLLVSVGVPLIAKATEDLYTHLTSPSDKPIQEKQLTDSDILYIRRKYMEWQEGKFKSIKTQQQFTDFINKSLKTSKSKASVMRIARIPSI